MFFHGFHFVGFVLFALLVLWPISKILIRTGYSGWLCLLAVVPLVNVVALWIFATAEWPSVQRH